MKAVNSNTSTVPGAPRIVSVLCRLFGYLPGYLGEVTTPSVGTPVVEVVVAVVVVVVVVVVVNVVAVSGLH